MRWMCYIEGTAIPLFNIGGSLVAVMEVLDVVEHDDGSATIEFAVESDQARHLVGEGLRYLILKGVFNLNDEEVFVALQGYADARD
jgi:hypothetical protein